MCREYINNINATNYAFKFYQDIPVRRMCPLIVLSTNKFCHLLLDDVQQYSLTGSPKTLCTPELLCCVSCFITSHWIHGLIFLYCLQDFSFHKLQAPGRVFILQQDHIDRSPIQALTDASTRSSKYPHDTHTQPPTRCSHFQPRGSCFAVCLVFFLMSNLLKSPWYLQGF